jgi:hypothetical protein
MPSFSEVYCWTNTEILTEIIALRPEGWDARLETPPQGINRIQIFNNEGGLEWEDAQLDRRLLLLNAFGWLFARSNPEAASFLWKRGDAPTGPVRAGDRPLPGVTFADPEDLDPAAIEAVYEVQTEKL